MDFRHQYNPTKFTTASKATMTNPGELTIGLTPVNHCFRRIAE